MRRRKATVELFEQIRCEYEFGIGTIQGVARQFGIHRRLVREAVEGAVPREKASPVRPRPRLEPVAGFIDAILDADRQAPRKQRHTAHRIYERLRQEHTEHPIAESTVRRYVRKRKAALGLLTRETFVPQSYAWGSEAQVDWYEAYADLGDERVKLQGVRAAEHGQRRRVSWCLSPRDPASVPGGPRAGVPLLRGHLPPAAVRQSHSSGEADPAGLAARGDGAVRGVPLALAVRGGILHAGGSPREGRGGERGRTVPAQPLGAGAPGPRPGGAERAAPGGVPGR